jgi:predicted dehydrogenase
MCRSTSRRPIEIYGDKGSLLVPDPNRFGGEVEVAKTGGEWEARPLTHGHVDGEFRSIGVADMATAIVTNRPHRVSGALAFHVLEVMEAFQTSADEGRRVRIESRVDRPAMMPVGRETGQID